MDVSAAVDTLFGGAVPERVGDLRTAWGTGKDRVRLLARPRFLLQQRWNVIQVNEIALRQIWLTGFAAWKAVQAYNVLLVSAQFNGWDFDPDEWHKLTPQRSLDEAFDKLLDAVTELSEVEDLADFTWPDDVPYPAEGLKLSDPEEKGTFDLVCMAGAYVFAHEIRHGILEAEGSAPADAIDEESECDRWALALMVDRAEEWATSRGVPPGAVRAKRILGVLVAKLTILTITPRSSWDTSPDHPPVRERMRAVLDAVRDPVPDWFWITVAAMLTAFSRRAGTSGGPALFPPTFRDLAYHLVDGLRDPAGTP